MIPKLFKSFDKRLFASLLLCFLIIPAIIISTHEGGHYAVARMQGHRNARLHYNHTDTGRNAIIDGYRELKNATNRLLPTISLLPNRNSTSSCTNNMKGFGRLIKTGNSLRRRQYFMLQGQWSICLLPL